MDSAENFNLQGMSANFKAKFYPVICSRKFMFFLDSQRKGKINLQQLLVSPVLSEFYEMRDVNAPEKYLRSNWFSAFSALRTYGQFLNLDKNRNGMISGPELLNYKNGVLTERFVHRLFSETQTYDGEMDFNCFLDFILAFENPNLAPSIHYLFKVYDIAGLGFLNEYSIRLFLQDMIDKMVENNVDPIPINDLVVIAFDVE